MSITLFDITAEEKNYKVSCDTDGGRYEIKINEENSTGQEISFLVFKTNGKFGSLITSDTVKKLSPYVLKELERLDL